MRHPNRLLQDLRARPGDAVHTAVILVLVLGAAGAFLVAGTILSLRDFGIVAAVALVAAGSFVTGNPRLYFLWGLMLTIPLNLSKRFGPDFIGKPGGEDSFRVEVSDVFLMALAVFLLWDVATGRRKGIQVPKILLPWVALIGIGVVWVIVGPWRTTAAHEVVRMIKVTFLFLVIVNEVRTPGRLWHCGAAMALGAMAQGAIGLVQYVKKGLIGLEVLGETNQDTIRVLRETSVQGVEVFRPSALMQHANLMGMYLGVMLPVAIALLMTARRTASRVYFIAAIALAAPGVVISLSRSAWLSAFVAVVIVMALMPFHPRLRWRSIKAGGAVGLVGVVVLFALSGPIVQRAFNSKDDSTVARDLYKADAKKMIAAAPVLGHGLNSYTFELPRYTSVSMATYGGNLPSVHHIFYLWWAETGIVGMLLWCAVWGGVIALAVANFTVRDDLLFAVNAACLAGMLCLIPDAFLSFTLRVNTMLRVFWLLAGLIVAIRYMRFREAHRLRTLRSRRSVVPPDLAEPRGHPPLEPVPGG